MLRKIISLVLSFGLLFQQASFAQVAAELNIANYLSRIGSNIVQDKFRPLHLRYFSYDSLNDNFKVLLDKGDLKNLKNPELESSTKTLLSYLLVGITLPDSMFWVNLRPDSEDQVINQYLEKTDVGKIMLEADLQLKKDTALFTSPQTPEGREYWNKLYKKAAELYGYDNVTIPTLTRPWIVPGEIIVRESNDSAYVYKATLKVMLEQDYLKDSATYNFKDERSKTLNEYSSQLIRELIIPKLTREVNSSKRYAALRQVYYSLILSRWFKLRFTGKTGTYASLINTKNLTNLISQESWSKTDYFKQYQKSFADGEYNIKEPVYTPTGQVIRSYFSGGINVAGNAINTQNGIINPKDISPDLLSHTGLMMGGNAVTGSLSNVEDKTSSSPIKQIFVDGKNVSEKWNELVTIDNGKAFNIEDTYKGKGIRDQIEGSDKFQFGLKLDEQGTIAYWGRNLTKDKELKLDVESDSIKDNGRDTDFIKVLNEFRDLRPKKIYDKFGKQLDPLKPINHQDPNDKLCPFACVDPSKKNSLLPEVRPESWKGEINGRLWRAQFNASPFENEGHFLWIPDILDLKQRRGQKVVYEDVLDILTLTRKSTNMIFFYNDPHAGGTVNHIHFQSFYHKETMAIEKVKPILLREIEGVEIFKLNNYLVEGLVFSNDKTKYSESQLARVIFEFINLLQEKQVPFNLIFIDDKVYLISRNPDGEIVEEFPTGVLASCELCGKIIIVDKETYDTTDFNKVKTAFSKITVTMKDIEGLVENVSNKIPTSPPSKNPDEKSTSSPMQSTPEKTGGIDFRALPMTIQPMGSFSGLNFKLPQLSQVELMQINVGSEIQQIKNMVQSGITPSGQRVKELVAACIQKKEMNSQADSLLLCLADIFKLEEENASESSPELREVLVIVDSQS